MPYWLESDTFADDPIWAALAGGRAALEDALQAAWCRLQSIAARIRSDGYLTEAQALRQCRGRRQLLDLLTRRVLEDREPRLHRRGDDCECLEGQWRDGYEFRIHRFLKKGNPSKRENTRHRAQAADLRDARLKQQVWERDGGCCRYCRSGPLPRKGMGRARDRRKVIQFDHVDPDQPAGPDAAGMVTSCARCNEHKGRRTPAEADMTLLPAPTEQQRREWLHAELTLQDPPDPATAPPASATDNATDNATTTQRQPDDALSDALSTRCPTTSPAAGTTAQPCAENGPSTAQTAPTAAATTTEEGLGSGRGGQPDGACVDALGQPPRPPSSPDVYTRRSRDPTWQPDQPPPQHPSSPPPPDDQGAQTDESQ